MKSQIAFLSVLFLPNGGAAFSKFPSAFTGRITSVCSRAELTTELACPPSRDIGNFRRGNSMSMPPFLKKLGLKKPGGEEKKEEEGASTAVLIKEEEVESSDIANNADEECVVPEELSETEKMMKQVKEAGTAGVISYALWELGFWTVSVPVCVIGYREATGHWPDFSNDDDLKQLGVEAFAFVNFARFAVPLRIGLALSTVPWIQENIVDKFLNKKDENLCEEDEK